RQGLDVALLQFRVGRMLAVPHRLFVLGMSSMVLRSGDARESDDGGRREPGRCESLHGRMVPDGWKAGPPGTRADRRKTAGGVAAPGKRKRPTGSSWALNIGGQGRNRTTDTRIFNPL